MVIAYIVLLFVKEGRDLLNFTFIDTIK